MTTPTLAETQAVAASSNPLLNRGNRMPGETVRLPSRGKFYADGEVLANTTEGEVLLRPITLTDEVMMKSPDMLMQGTAIEYTFKRCSPHIISPLDLVMPDVNFILTHLRRISLGSDLSLTYYCSKEKCQHKQTIEVPLSTFTQTSKELEDAELGEAYRYVTQYDNSVVELRPVTLRDFLKMQEFSMETMSSPEEYAKYLRRSFISIIKSVNGHTVREDIEEWLDTLPIEDVKEITKKLTGIQGLGPKFEFKHKCKKCGTVNDLSTEINPTSFFIEHSDLETEKE